MSTPGKRLPNPSYLPPGFSHQLDVFGTDTAAFGFDPQQVARIFTRDLRIDSWNRPLMIAWVPRIGAVLCATENRPGTDVDVGSTSGVYHDGLWQFGDGADEVSVDGTTLYWDRSDLHSITLGIGGGTLAIRASRLAGVDLAALKRIGATI